MANYYYVTAVAPATITVSGRRFNLAPGDTRGPFSEIELGQIMSGSDRSRLVSTKTVTSEDTKPPTVQPTAVDGMGMAVKTNDTEVVSSVPSEGKSYEESQPAPSIDVPEKINYTATFTAEEPVAPPAEPEVVEEVPGNQEPLVVTEVQPLDPEEPLKPKRRSRRSKAAEQ